MRTKNKRPGFFEKLSTNVSKNAGSTGAFMIAVGVIVVWLVTGPLFHFSDTWQLVINTGTTIITFLMVFLIQRSQNKEALAIQVKLNELIASSQHASNRLIDIENLTEDDLKTLDRYYAELVKRSKSEKDIHQSHSIDEAAERHSIKVSEGKRIRSAK